jgi:hypothetical protein
MAAHRLLQDIALDNLRHLLSGTSATIKVSRVTGLYGGYIESGLALRVAFDEKDRKAVLAALAKFADNFNREQVHVRRKTAVEIGTEFDDGSYVTPVYKWTLKEPLSRKQIEKVIAESGLPGLTFGDDFIEAYYVGDPKDGTAISKFENAISRADQFIESYGGKIRRTAAQLWVYGDRRRGLGFERIRGDVPSGTGVANQTARRVETPIGRLTGTAPEVLIPSSSGLGSKPGDWASPSTRHGLNPFFIRARFETARVVAPRVGRKS